MEIRIHANEPIFAFRAHAEPVARVAPGDCIAIETTDAPYRELTGDAIDGGEVSLSRANALTGPIWIKQAEAGDAIGFTIDSIELGDTAHVVYVARWRRGTFGVTASRVDEYPIVDGEILLPNGRRLAVRPMIGCIGVAPATGSVSALSPCAPTGGNMDLVELVPGATIWLPCRVPGGLLALGDLHARMGRGEPVGCGFECAGVVHGTIRLAKGQQIDQPVIVTAERIAFVGSHQNELEQASRLATAAAWSWLRCQADLTVDEALAIAAGVLEIDFGGPAGANAVASLSLAELRAVGIRLTGWPFAMIP